DQLDDPSKAKRIQIIAAVSWVVIIGAWSLQRALNPDPLDLQAVVDVKTHPIASALGALLPSIILASFAYWTCGLVLRHLSRDYRPMVFSLLGLWALEQS